MNQHCLLSSLTPYVRVTSPVIPKFCSDPLFPPPLSSPIRPLGLSPECYRSLLTDLSACPLGLTHMPIHPTWDFSLRNHTMRSPYQGSPGLPRALRFKPTLLPNPQGLPSHSLPTFLQSYLDYTPALCSLGHCALLAFYLLYNKLSQSLVAKTAISIYYLTQFLRYRNPGAAKLGRSGSGLLMGLQSRCQWDSSRPKARLGLGTAHPRWLPLVGVSEQEGGMLFSVFLRLERPEEAATSQTKEEVDGEINKTKNLHRTAMVQKSESGDLMELKCHSRM